MQLNLGQKIRELRQRDGRTQETLAEAIGVTSQAVSRWEANGGYPDMEMIPSIAHYFGVSIDELFGYNNERSQKINMLIEKIENMNFQNNGVDINIGECISFARNALIEFPGNEKIMLCLASVLYNAGYVRYGEHHLSDSEGYDILDTETLGCHLMAYLGEKYPDALKAGYKLPALPEREESENDVAYGYRLLEAAGRKRGFLVSGGDVDTERMAKILLDEFRAGKLGRFTLELPE